MRNRKVRVIHDGEEFYLVDQGRTRASRVITFLKPLKSADAASACDNTARVRTDIGDCRPVANWTEGGLEVEKDCEGLRSAFAGIVERYLEEFRVGRSRQGARTYYFLSIDRLPLYALSSAHPTGLSVLVFSDEEGARAAARQRRSLDGRDIRIESTQNLHDFLCARATDGFAGATLDEKDPLFFCLDASGSPRCLRLTVDEESGRLDHLLLTTDGEWQSYDGEEDLVPELDQDVVDRHMLDRLGPIPYLGFCEGAPLLRPVRSGSAGGLVILPAAEEDHGPPVSPVFADEQLAREFLEEHDLGACELEPVVDLAALIGRADREGAVVQLHPGGHRARSGVLWMADGRVILDSFSGLWSSRDGRSFTPESDAGDRALDDTSSSR